MGIGKSHMLGQRLEDCAVYPDQKYRGVTPPLPTAHGVTSG